MFKNTSPGVQGQPSFWIREVLRQTTCQMSLLLKVGYPMLAYDGGCPQFICCSPQGEDGTGVNVLSRWLCFITQTEDFDPHLVDSFIVLLIDLESLVMENFISQSGRRRTSSPVRLWLDCCFLHGWSTIL